MSIVTARAAEPRVPSDEKEVLEVLPQSLYSSRDELTRLREQLAKDPNNAELAATVASRYLQIGKSEGDPRFYGYAQAAIGPWWEAASAPPEILRLRAKLKERDHRYDQAVADLKLLVGQLPQDIQAWIELANIYGVQGKYAEARQACEQLSKFAEGIPVVICSAPLQAVTGHAEEAYASLTGILPQVREHFPSVVPWVLTMQAEISRALGQDERADQLYRESLALDPGDYYSIRAYGDFLLDQDRAAEALVLCREHVSDTGVLLCAAIAARRSGSAEEALAAEWQAQLKGRFAETRLRGTGAHGRYEARYELELLNNPRQAFTLAVANWEQQKQLPDSRVLLEAAIAAKEHDQALPVLEFLKQNGTQDVVLERLAKKLEQH